MWYWVGLFLVELILLGCYKHSHTEKGRNVALFWIIFFLVYFSGFRDGLGMDYSAYKGLCEREVYNSSLLWLSEPLFRGLQSFCYNTQFSAVFLFLTSAFMTCTCCLWVYSKNDNFVLAAFVFIFYTGLYLFTFNIVSQFTAASLILLGYFFYVKEKNSKTLIVLLCTIFCGVLMHRSSVFMLIPLFFRTRKLNMVMWVSLILLSFVVPMKIIFNIPGVRDFLIFSDYAEYMEYSMSGVKKLSLSNLYMHLLLIPFLINYKTKIKNRDDARECIFLIKMFAMFLIMSNLSTGNLTITYRLAVFFVVFIPILIARLPQIIDKKIAYLLIIVPLLILMSMRLMTGDRLTVPDRILPLNSIFDKYYNPYVL